MAKSGGLAIIELLSRVPVLKEHMSITTWRLLLGCALVMGLAGCGPDSPGRPAAGAVTDQPAWAAQAGTDAHGRWADLTVGTTTQRFRYIAPCTFTMGLSERGG